MLTKNLFNIIFITGFFSILSTFCQAQDIDSFSEKDTVTLGEIPLDSIRFYLSRDFSRVENNVKDTLFVPYENKILRIPYKITSTAISNVPRGRQYFRLTGLFLDQDSLGYYIKDLFRNPRERLKDSISAIDWKNSDVYLRYFEPYDFNSEYLSNNTESNKEKANSDDDEFQNFLAEGNVGYVAQNYESFPLPQTIDLEVDLKKSPRVLSVLGLEFNFDKLAPELQKLLLRFGNLSQYENRRSVESKGK
ncbi:MAG: hypothetical protein ABI462_04215 [Ignavibacteria bacterium]